MTNPSPNDAFVVRRCRVGDVRRLSDLLRVCWHSTYDEMLGRDQAAQRGRHLYSRFNLGLWLVSTLRSRQTVFLVAAHGEALVGYAMAQHDGAAEIILYALYVHPEWQGKGIGTALLDAAVSYCPAAKAIRLEVLKDNAAAIAWYRGKGFQSYGETKDASGMADVAALYMDKQLEQTNH